MSITDSTLFNLGRQTKLMLQCEGINATDLVWNRAGLVLQLRVSL